MNCAYADCSKKKYRMVNLYNGYLAYGPQAGRLAAAKKLLAGAGACGSEKIACGSRGHGEACGSERTCNYGSCLKILFCFYSGND